MPASAYVQVQVLGWFRGSAIGLSTMSHIYIGLANAHPGVNGLIGEPIGGGYARVDVPVPSKLTTIADGAVGSGDRLVDNVDVLTWNCTSGAGWGTIQYVTAWTVLTGTTNFLGFGGTTPQNITSGMSYQFPIANLDIIFRGN